MIAYLDPNDVINKTSVVKQVVAMLRLDALHLMAGKVDANITAEDVPIADPISCRK